jgi:hypothetical protein
LKFDEVTVQHVHRRPFRAVLYSRGEADVLDSAVLSFGVHRRCFHGCFQKGLMAAFIWTMVEIAKAPKAV